MNKLQQILTKAFSTNFMLYYSSHVAHVNIVGRNFTADHQLLGKIYEDAQEQIDTYAEFMRTVECFMPTNLTTAIVTSEIGDVDVEGNSTKLLDIIYDNTETMLEVLKSLYDAAESAGELGLSNYVQDRMVIHRKFCWMLKSTLENGKK
jgi:starvation-inducible DNA-binding protein